MLNRYINILAWLAFPVMAYAITGAKFCLETTCLDIVRASLLPFAVLTVFINSIIKRDFQSSIILLWMIIVAALNIIKHL